MKRLLVFMLSAIIILASVCASAVPLYKVERNGKTNWILGTIHMPLAEEELPQSLKEALLNADIFVSEAGSPEQIQTFRKWEFDVGFEAARTPPQRSFSAMLSPNMYVQLKDILIKSEFNIDLLERISAYHCITLLNKILGEYEHKRVTSKIIAYASTQPEKFEKADKKLSALLAREGLQLPPPTEPVETPDLDLLLAQIANLKSIPTYQLDTPEDNRQMQALFNDSDLEDLIKVGLKRITVTKQLSDDDRLNYIGRSCSSC